MKRSIEARGMNSSHLLRIAIDRLAYLRNSVLLSLQRPSEQLSEDLPLQARNPDFEQLLGPSVGWFAAVLEPYVAECRWMVGRVYNGFFESVDAEFYYCVIRTFQPKQIIEIGSGHSTLFALDAVRRNGHGSITSIDPIPTRNLRKKVDQIPLRVEEVDIAIFDMLDENDILFIDSSHTRAEAEYHTARILPRIARGCLVHHHDILYPYEKRYDEEDIILNFYSATENRQFQVISGLAYVRYADRELVKRLVPSFSWKPNRTPASLWTRKQPKRKETLPSGKEPEAVRGRHRS